MRTLALFFLATTSSLFLACGTDDDFLTTEEVDAAIDSVVLIGQARQAIDDATAMSTAFTVGDGLAAAVDAVRTFVESEAPCANVDAGTAGQLTIDFGTVADACTYRGRQYAGGLVVGLEAAGGGIAITHTYTNFSNGVVTIDGEADVAWNGGARAITAQYELDGTTRDLSVTENRTSLYRNESMGPAGGIEIEGERSWTGSLGSWEMQIENVEVRPVDPVPYAGRYSLVTPRDLPASMDFSRVDDTTIEMVFTGPKNQYTYRIDADGNVEDVTPD